MHFWEDFFQYFKIKNCKNSTFLKTLLRINYSRKILASKSFPERKGSSKSDYQKFETKKTSKNQKH